MIKKALKYLVELGGIHTKSLIDGTEYITSGEHCQIVRMPVLAPIACNTLTGIVDFINMQDTLLPEERILLIPICIHIKSHCEVELIGDLDNKWLNKKLWVKAGCKVFDSTNMESPLEEFLIWIQSCFVQDYETNYLLEILSKITASNGVEVTDKGVSLAIKRKKDIHFKENDKMRSQFSLRPYRTFSEIEQPESLFVLRVHDSANGISISMSETTDPTWKLRAINSIKAFFQERITDSSISIIA
jgi:hypothetical protein